MKAEAITVFHERNEQTGVSVTVRKLRTGEFALLVTDTNAGKLVGTKWFSTQAAAVAYAKLCLK